MRVTTRLISAIAAALVAVAAGVALIELTLAALGRTPWVVNWRSLETFGQENSWDDGAVRLMGVAFFVAGIALLLAVLRPRRAVALESGLGTEVTVLTVRRRSLEALVARSARSVDGVSDASARWNGRSMTVEVTTRRTVPVGIDDAVGPRVEALLRAWRVDSEPARVTVRSVAPHTAPHTAPLPPTHAASPDDGPMNQAAEPEEVLR